MTLSRFHACLALLLLGCATAPPTPRKPFVLGDHVHARGTADYRVVTQCNAVSECIDVEGTGTRWFAGAPFHDFVSDDARVRAELGKMRALLRSALASIPSVHASSFGGDCSRRITVGFFFEELGDVDALIARVGAWLAQNQLRDTVHLCRVGRPVLH